jgi:hypothetical protein
MPTSTALINFYKVDGFSLVTTSKEIIYSTSKKALVVQIRLGLRQTVNSRQDITSLGPEAFGTDP